VKKDIKPLQWGGKLKKEKEKKLTYKIQPM
jgi:hypothetical protein